MRWSEGLRNTSGQGSHHKYSGHSVGSRHLHPDAGAIRQRALRGCFAVTSSRPCETRPHEESGAKDMVTAVRNSLRTLTHCP
jgi:hypothetical protein